MYSMIYMLSLLKRYATYELQKTPNVIVSPASIGKAYLDRIGIKPFLELNPTFPPEIIGYITSNYYGARSECTIAKTPVKVSYLDFTSMYPSEFMLLGLDAFLKAGCIDYEDSTERIQKLLNDVTLESLKDKKFWLNLPCICKFKPKGDVLPWRGKLESKTARNISLTCIDDSDTSIWYALADLIASKLHTGKTPIIEQAISFKAYARQSNLNTINMVGDIELKPGDNLFKRLIEERQRLKFLIKAKDTPDKLKDVYKVQEHNLKIIANATSYGIYMQVDSEEPDGNRHDVTVYGLDTFNTLVSRIEKPGIHYNPIIASSITSGARLILAIAEKLLIDNGGYLAYCDTDSVLISPEHVGLI